MATRRLVLGTALIGLAACVSSNVPRLGKLVIVGGGLNANNAAVFAAFLDDAGQRIVVLPTASGVPEESGPSTAEKLEMHTGAERRVEIVAINADTPERALDPRYVEPIEQAGAVWFTGGVQSRISAVFRPGGNDSPGYRALQSVLDRGGTIGGSSAGAAIMSDPMIAGGGSREALLTGVRSADAESGLALEQGLDFFPYGIVDQHFLRRGRVGRMLVALEHSGRQLGYGIADNCALAVDLASGRGRAIGDHAVVVIDASKARREGLSRRGFRVSLASTGDELVLERGELIAGAGKGPLAPARQDATDDEALAPWGRDTLTRLLERLARDPGREQRARGEHFTLVVRADEHTRFLARDGNLAGITVAMALLDVDALAQASPTAE